MPILELRNVSYGFSGAKSILADLSLTLEAGCIYALMGANGAGKTTLFNIISGFIRANFGDVFFDSTRITHLAPHRINRTGIGRTFQDLRLISKLTVKENIVLAMNDNPTQAWHRAMLPEYFYRSQINGLNKRAEEIIERCFLTDVRYTTKETINALDKPPDGKAFTRKDLEGKVLTTGDLAKAVEDYSQQRNSQFRNNFIDSNATFYLYSFVSGKFNFAFGLMSERANLTSSFFRNCNFKAIDTRNEFYRGDDFISKYDPDYYAHQASNLINRIIEHEFAEFILKDSQRQRLTRIKQTASIIGILTIIGFASEWLGKFVFKVYDQRNIFEGLIVVLITVIALVVVGSIIFYFVEEKIVRRIAEDAEADNPAK